MSWAEVLLLLVAYCGGGEGRDACRLERTACVQKAVASQPAGNNAAEIINLCLSNPKAYDNAKPLPVPSPSPKGKKK